MSEQPMTDSTPWRVIYEPHEDDTRDTRIAVARINGQPCLRIDAGGTVIVRPAREFHQAVDEAPSLRMDLVRLTAERDVELASACSWMEQYNRMSDRAEALEAQVARLTQERDEYKSAHEQAMKDCLNERSCRQGNQDAVRRLEAREAECHDIISALNAIQEPDLDLVLQKRVNRVLGAEDAEGHCGNAICAALLEAELAKEQAEADATSLRSRLAALTNRLAQLPRHGCECLPHASIGSDMAASVPVVFVEDLLAALTAKLAPYCEHYAGCSWFNGGTCTCGLAALTGEPQEPAK